MLVVGAIVALVSLPYVNIPFDAAVGWLGIALTRPKHLALLPSQFAANTGVRFAAHEVAGALSARVADR